MADSKVGLDSNADGMITAKIYAQSDAKLSQKVTYEAKFKSVQQILDDLRQMTGVRLVAGARDSDWVVRSRKMNIFVKDVPLSDLMDSIAHVMKFRWSRFDNVKPSMYRLLIDKKAAAVADAMMKRGEKAKEAMWQTRREEWIDAIMKYGSLSIEDSESLREENPIVFRYARYGAVQALRALFEEVPEAKARFAAGQGCRISSEALSPATKSLLYEAGNGYWKYLQMSGQVCEATDNPPGYGDVLRPDQAFDIAWVRMDETGGFTPGLRWGGTHMSCGYFHLMKDGWDKEMADLRSLNEDWSKLLCEINNNLLDHKVFSDDFKGRYVSQQAKLAEKLKAEEESFYPSEPLTEHKTFPEQENKIKLSVKPESPDDNPVKSVNNYIASFQKVLFEKTGMGIVSDSWVNTQGEMLSNYVRTLGETLDEFSKNFKYNWDNQGAILEFRHRKWAKMRLNQISDESVAVWVENTKTNGHLSLDDLTAISNLKYDQAEESLKCDDVLGQKGLYKPLLRILDANGNIIWLRLYSTLTAQQRQLLMGDFGLNGFMLTSSQWKLAQPMFDRIGSTRSDAIFRMSVSDDKLTYQFREIDTESDAEDRVWEVTLPTYTPPTSQEVTK